MVWLFSRDGNLDLLHHLSHHFAENLCENSVKSESECDPQDGHADEMASYSVLHKAAIHHADRRKA